VAVSPNFWHNLMQTRCSFNTSISQYDGGTNTIALQINSRLSQDATHSSCMWHQEMLLSILHGCDFDTLYKRICSGYFSADLLSVKPLLFQSYCLVPYLHDVLEMNTASFIFDPDTARRCSWPALLKESAETLTRGC
jgi:hypothetical protein